MKLTNIITPSQRVPNCGHCGEKAKGFAFMNATRLCHPDFGGMDCYSLVINSLNGHTIAPCKGCNDSAN